MSKLEMAALEDIAEDVTVSHVGPTSEFFRESGIPFLRTGNVGSGRLNLKDIRYVTKEFHLKNKKSALKAGDVLVTRVISNEVNCGVVPDELGEANCGNVILIRPGARLVSAYLVHLIRNPNVQRALIQRRVGSAQSVVNTSVLKAWKIPVISTVEQKRIAEILDRAEELRSKRREAIAQLDILTKAIFLEMFGDPKSNPKNWSVKFMAALFATSPIFGTMIPPVTEKLGWLSLRVGNIQNWNLDLSDRKYVDLPPESIARHSVKDGDLLLARAIASQDHLGKCVVAHPSGENWAFDSHLMRLRFDRNLSEPEFIRHLFMTTGGRSLFLSASRKSTVQFNINTKEIAALRLPVPPIDLQREFAHRIGAVEKLKAAHRASLSELDALFASLQHRAFRGEL